MRCARGALYCGIAKDVLARVAQHNAGKGSKAVLALGRPVELVFWSARMGHVEALRMERAVKSMSREYKEGMVAKWTRKTS